MFTQNDDAREVKKAEEVRGFDLVSRRQASAPQEPREETFDFPATLVTTKRATVLATGTAAATNRRDQLDAVVPERCVELAAVVRFVADELLRLVFREPLGERGFDKSGLVTFT